MATDIEGAKCKISILVENLKNLSKEIMMVKEMIFGSTWKLLGNFDLDKESGTPERKDGHPGICT